MEWWQYVIVSVIPIIIYKLRKRAAARGAIYDILVELRSNVGLAKQPFRGSLVSFENKMWDRHKGKILALPDDIQDALLQAYNRVQEANALVQSGLQLAHGLGYYDRPYQQKCNEIAEKAGEASELLRRWLRQEGVKELPNAKRQSP